MKTGSSLVFSDHEMVEFNFLKGENKVNSRTTTLTLRGVEFCLFKDLIGLIAWSMIMERKRVKDSRLNFKNHLLQVQELSIPICMKSSKGGRRPTWMHKKLSHKRKCTRDGSRIRSSRRDIETFPKCVGI